MKTEIHQIRKENKKEIELIELNSSVFAFKITKTMTMFDHENKPVKTKRSFKQGLIEKLQKEPLLKGRKVKTQKAYICSDTFIKSVKKSSFQEAKIIYFNNEDHISSNVFDQIASGKFTPDNIYYLDSISKHIFKDLKGNVVPHMIRFDICLGDITNENFDIEKLAEFLLKKENITFSRYKTNAPKKRKHQLTPRDIITTIDKRFTINPKEDIQSIAFNWQPTDVEFDFFYQKAVKLNPEYPELAYRTVIHQMDLLGFRKHNLIINENYKGDE